MLKMRKAALIPLLLAICAAHKIHACNSLNLPTLTEPLRTIPACNPKQGECMNARAALFKRFGIGRDDDPRTLSLLMRASPWHVFDADYRIMQLDDLKQMIKSQLKPGMTQVELAASWTASKTMKNKPPMVQQLASAYPALKFSGVDGFAWITPKGKIYGTKQAFSLMNGHGYPYQVNASQDIMLGFIDGVALSFDFKKEAIKNRHADDLLAIAMAEESFGLCLDTALDTYVEAAKLGSNIAAYNAAMLYLDQGKTAEAQTWLQLAAKRGDQPAAKLLKQLDNTGKH